MALNDETKARIELLVGIDKTTYAEARKRLGDLFKDRGTLQLDTKALDNFAAGVRDAIAAGGKDVDVGLATRFDKTVGDILKKFQDVQAEIVAATNAGDEAKVEALLGQQKLLSDQVEAETDAHKKRLDAAKKLKKALSPDLPKMREASEFLGEGFLNTLGKAKSKDMAGLVQGLLGGAAKGAGKMAGVADTAKAAAATEKGAKMLGLAAGSLATAAGVLAIAGGALAAVVALLKMADDQARELNKTLLEGASMADFAFKGDAARISDVTENLNAARRASLQLADEYRGQADEFAGILAQLNQAGFSYKEMGKAAGYAKTEQQALADAAEQTFVWSKALGLSIGEVAEAEAEWSRTFGSDLAGMGQKFAEIQGAAMQGGFNVKRFFTAVSQATAGMAIYNIRMEEAAFLLSKTSKILGDTDASDFIRSLTQGFADESMVDRMKRIMIAGGKDTQKIFEGTAKRTATGFVDTFNNAQTKGALTKAFEGAGVTVDISNQQALQDTWGKISDEDRRLVIGQLRQNKDEQSAAAARQLETLGRVVDGAKGGFSAQVKGLAALDMQGKLAYKLQTLGDTRLNDMSAVELAAFEQYAGIGGAQLEQLMRVESQLMADYELAKKTGTTTAKDFDEYIATNEEASQKLDEVQKIEDQATWFARSTVKNTRSVWEVLQNTIATILNDIYGLMGTWFASSKSLSKESIDKQGQATALIRSQRDVAEKRLEGINDKLSKVDETLATTGKDTEAHQEALQEKKKLEDDKRQTQMTSEYLSAQSRQVFLLDEAQMQDLKSSDDVLGAASLAMSKSGEDIAIAGQYLSAEDTMKLAEAKSDIAKSSHFGQKVQEAQGMTGGMALLGGARLAEMVGLNALTGTKGPMEEAADVQVAQSGVVPDLLLTSADLSEESADTLMRQEETQDKSLKLQKKEMQADKKFHEAFPDENKDSTLDAMKLYEGWKLGIQAGLSGEDLTSAAQEWASGDTIKNRGKLAAAMAAAGMDPRATGGGGGGGGPAVLEEFGESDGSVGGDFIMRPGQPAQLFSPGDTVFGMKAGGPLTKGNGGGGTVIVNVNGGDQSAVYRTVKDALKNSGLRP